MSFRQKLRNEIKAVALATLYFATWLGALVVLKALVMAEYGIEFHGLSQALVGALVLAKVVLVLEHVPLGAWIRTQMESYPFRIRKESAMLRRSYRFIGFLICCFSPLMISPAWSAEQPKKAKAPHIEPRAAQVLKHMADYLQGLQQFSVQAEITEDVLLDSGLTIQDGRSVTASVRRPNRLRVDSLGDLGDRQLVYDGKTMTFMDLSKNVYSTIDVPPEIDAALHHAIQAYNLRAPLADLIYANAYDYLMEETRAGFYLGLSKVQGQPCHHLAFRQKEIDWQIWIEDGPTPLPRKFLITDKKAKGLQFTAWLSQWNTSPQLEDGLFTFVVPAKAEKVDLRPVAALAGPKKTKK